MKNNCPVCGKGEAGKDALCDKHYSNYLGTHCGGRDDDGQEYKQWCEEMKKKGKTINRLIKGDISVFIRYFVIGLIVLLINYFVWLTIF